MMNAFERWQDYSVEEFSNRMSYILRQGNRGRNGFFMDKPILEDQNEIENWKEEFLKNNSTQPRDHPGVLKLGDVMSSLGFDE